MKEKIPLWLFFILLTTIGGSAIAALDGQYEMAVLFSFWASLSMSIHALITDKNK